jgi:sugar lactone lactonase YvrE
MLKKGFLWLLILFTIISVYLLIWPVPIEPIAWNAPVNLGYTGKFAVNTRLANLELLPIGYNAPEDIAINKQGQIYVSTETGDILHLQADGSQAKKWVNTGGRPLGITFDEQGNLLVADAFKGLLCISPEGEISLLTDISEGLAIRYANHLDVAQDGKIYFTDSSSKFSAKASGSTYKASLLDISEHGGHGRLLVYNPHDKTTHTLLKQLNFANGVAISPKQDYLLVNETGSYRVIRYHLTGDKKGQSEIILENLPSFPDNISTGSNGRYWIALVSPRSAILDTLSNAPFLRKVIQRMPAFLRPKAVAYSHIIAIDGQGQVIEDRQDPAGHYGMNTSVIETKEYLYIGNLFTAQLGRIKK